MSWTTGEKIAIGAGLAAAAVLAGVVYYEKHKSPAAPAVLTGSSSAMLTPGTMANVILSLAAGNTYTFSLPAGATFGTTSSAFTSDNPSVIPTPTSSVSPVTVTPMATGQATLTVQWNTAAGVAVTSTVLITVNS